jgi:hypothetical protein
MSIQEKIDQLALAALRSAPVMGSRPRPSTFMPDFEKPQRVAIVESSGQFLDARYGGSSRENRQAALAVANSPWPFGAREVRL